MNYCNRKVTRWCPGHSSTDKFPDCLIESLVYAGADESTGTVDWDVWAGLYVVEVAESLHGHGGWSVDVPAGTYAVITEDDRGFIGWDMYPSAEDAQAAFDRIDQAYGLWCEEEDRREQEIIMSRGGIGR